MNKECEATVIMYADKYEGEHKLRQCDEVIKQTEATLARLKNERDEILKFYGITEK